MIELNLVGLGIYYIIVFILGWKLFPATVAWWTRKNMSGLDYFFQRLTFAGIFPIVGVFFGIIDYTP